MSLNPLRALLIAGLGFGVIPSAISSTQTSSADWEAVRPCDIPQELYTVPVNRVETSPEEFAYRRLLAAVRIEDARPGFGFIHVSQEYPLAISEALTLLKGVRSVRDATADSEPKVWICRADISSAQDYVDWWTQFDAEMRAHRRVVIDALESAVGAAVWKSVTEREYARWLASEDFGKKINRQAQVEVADYRIWMRGMCGERDD